MIYDRCFWKPAHGRRVRNTRGTTEEHGYGLESVFICVHPWITGLCVGVRRSEARVYFHSTSAPRARRFSTKRGWARLMVSAFFTTLRPGMLAATMNRPIAARMT